jgi:hypothetical protein
MAVESKLLDVIYDDDVIDHSSSSVVCGQWSKRFYEEISSHLF